MFDNTTTARTAHESHILDATLREDAQFPKTELVVLVDEEVPLSDFRFERDGNIWYGEKNGMAEFFAWSETADHQGYGGQAFRLTMADGEDVVLPGPYSSRAGAVNLHGFGPVVNAMVTDDRECFEDEWTMNHRLHLTLDAARYAASLIDTDVELVEELKFSDDEPYYIPRMK